MRGAKDPDDRFILHAAALLGCQFVSNDNYSDWHERFVNEGEAEMARRLGVGFKFRVRVPLNPTPIPAPTPTPIPTLTLILPLPLTFTLGELAGA